MSGGQLPGAAQQAVDHIAYCAVAAVYHDKVDPVLDRGLCDLTTVAAVVSVLDGQLQAAFGARLPAGRAPPEVVDVAVGLTISTARIEAGKPTGVDPLATLRGAGDRASSGPVCVARD